MAQIKQTQSYPYPIVDRDVRVRIEGSFSGKAGVVELFYKKHRIVKLELSRLRWSIIALLALAALNGTGLKAFQDGDKLAEQLRDLGVIVAAVAKSVNQAINKFRKQLESSELDWPAGVAKQNLKEDLVETQKPGYRLGLSPAQIELIILDDHKKIA